MCLNALNRDKARINFSVFKSTSSVYLANFHTSVVFSSDVCSCVCVCVRTCARTCAVRVDLTLLRSLHSLVVRFSHTHILFYPLSFSSINIQIQVQIKTSLFHYCANRNKIKSNSCVFSYHTNRPISLFVILFRIH